MPTRLSHKKVKSSDPAYTNLTDQLQHLGTQGDGTGYTVPTGGIPRTHMTSEVQTSLGKADTSYQKPSTGIITADLEQAAQDNLAKASTSYQKPSTGIPKTDLEQATQDDLAKIPSMYVFPSTGIPYVDMDLDVKGRLDLASTAYQKPSLGIPATDLDSAVQGSLGKADTAYQKPSTGIPVTDIADDVVTGAEATELKNHINDTTKHITDHAGLTGTGKYSHIDIDSKLDHQEATVKGIHSEISKARDTFSSLDARINSMLGRNTVYEVTDKNDWSKGTFTGLRYNDEGNVSFDFTTEQIQVMLYDITDREAMDDVNKIGFLTFNTETTKNLGTNPWLQTATKSYYNYVGTRLVTYVYAPVTGKYRFSFQFSGKTKLQIAGKLLFDESAYYGSMDGYTRSAEIELEGGRLYPVVAEGRYLTTGTRVFSLFWKAPNQTYETAILTSGMNMSGYTVTNGVYESHIIDFKDAAISKWYLIPDMTDYRVDDDITAEISTSTDGVTFTTYTAIPIGEIPVTPARYVKFKLTLHKNFAQYTPLLHGFKIRYISSANNQYWDEIIKARDTFISLGERLGSITQQISGLSQTYNTVEASSIHPEHFSSVRLADIELNFLNEMIRETESLPNYLSIRNGVVDCFNTSDFIDVQRSEQFEIANGKLRQKQNRTRFDLNEDWAKFTLDRMIYTDHRIQLSPVYGGFDGTKIFALSNYNSWSTSNYARIAGDYQDMIAQPFYTRIDASVVNRIMIDGYDGWYAPRQDLMLCPTTTDGRPDWQNPLWKIDMGYPHANQMNYDNLRIPVKPNTKYWIVIRLTAFNSGVSTGYNRWWQDDAASSDPRIQYDNPEGKYLSMQYTSTDGTTWGEHSNYSLKFYLTESTEFESEGFGSHIIDYKEPSVFKSDAVHITNQGDGIVSITYQSSDDQVIWSAEYTNIADVPQARFLKLNVHLTKSSTGYGSPIIDMWDVFNLSKDVNIISKPIPIDRVPTHVTFLAESDDPTGVSYLVSRDDGGTWTDLKTNVHTDLSTIQPGNKLRIQAVFDGSKESVSIDHWAIIGVTYRDITGQNITALYEEYVASEGQQAFPLQGSYPMGNNALQVYLNGIRQSIGKDYLETDNKTVTFTEPLIGGVDPDRVTLIVATGAYDAHDYSMVSRINDIEDIHEEEMMGHTVDYTYDADGRIVKAVYTGTNLPLSIDYVYNSLGYKTQEKVTRGTKVKTTDYSYDANNRIVKETVTFSEVII